MLDRFRIVFTDALYSVKDLKQKRADINKKIKDRLGDEYDLDGNENFPKVVRKQTRKLYVYLQELKPYQILGLAKLVNMSLLESDDHGNNVALV